MKIEKGCAIVFRWVGSGSFWYYDTDDIYDTLELADFDVEEAIKASCWCELSTVGEMYFGNGFTIEIVEDY